MNCRGAAWLVTMVCAAAPARADVRHGNVTYRTASHAFVNVGTRDGVRAGDVLALESLDRSRTPCKVDQVADHAARCVGQHLPAHAAFELQHAAAPDPDYRTFASATLPALQRDKARIEQAPVELVAAPVSRVPAFLRRRSWAAVTHEAYLQGSTYNLDRQVERVDLQLRGMPLTFADLSASVRLTALAWSVRKPAMRFRPSAPVQLYVWQGEVDRRGSQDNLVFAVGRVLPWNVPGLPVMDGLQLGYRAPDAQTEAGAFAGALPDMMTLIPSFRRWSAGAYATATRRLGGAVWSNSGRLAVVGAPIGTRLELEAQSWLSVGRDFQMSLMPRFGTALASPRLQLDGIRGDLTAHLGEQWTFAASGRWSSAIAAQQDGFLDAALARPNTYADASLRYSPFAWLQTAVVGVVDATVNNALHYLVGPEVGLPRLFGGAGGVTAAYLYENGSAPGQSAYFQGMLSPANGLWVWLRVSYYLDPFMGGRDLREMALLGRADWRFTDVFTVSGSVLVRPQLPNATYDAATLASVMARLALSARL